NVDRERSELMIALIPHVVRRPEFTEENLRGIAVGNQASVHLNYGRRPSEAAAPAAAPRREEPAAAAPAENAAAAPPATAPQAAVPPSTAAQPGSPPATAPPATAPPATAPPATALPATAPDAAKPAAPAGSASVHFLPAQAATTVQGSVTVALVIEGASDAASAPLQIQFDPKVVRLSDVGRGDFFTSDGQVPVFTKNIQNDAGAATINLNRLPGTPGANGSGVLATMVFQGL